MPTISPLAIYLVILVVSFAVLLSERLRNDLVAILIVLALATTSILTPEEALSGFSSEAAIVVASIFVLTAALHQTGVSEILGTWIGRLAGSSFTRITAVVMPAVALMSAFTHHVTTTAVMLPVIMETSRTKGVPASKLLMPMSFAASLGTTITIIGAPAFLIASSVLQQNGRPGLGVFSIAPIGLAISAAGTLFVLLFGRFLLPTREGAANTSDRFSLGDYYTEVTVLPGSPFAARTVAEVSADTRYPIEVAGWMRDGRELTRPFQGPIEEGDVLLVRTSADGIRTIREDAAVELHPVLQYPEEQAKDGAPRGSDDEDNRLLQAVVAPTSDLANRTIAEVNFHRRFGAVVLGLWRRHAQLTGEMAHIRLKPGDVLVLQGDEGSLTRIAETQRDFLAIPFQGEIRVRRKAPLTVLIMLGTIIAAATGTPLQIAALAGAAAVVLTRCVTPRQAYRAIDQRIFVFIAGAIPLGTAMTKTGASELVARSLSTVMGGWGEWAVLLVIFAVVAVLTQFMSDSATTAIFAPVAAALAAGLGRPPEAYVVTVAMASVAAFLTPIGHHGNLLIYGPGRYRFNDFVRVGTPLTILVGVIVVTVARLLWP
ncbi:MAG: SLC13 family permease [Chloroflexi bacterium]|nr:SLC13 family permease [Chloroflexota bacterium]